jgi:hypothetical protein
MWKERRAVPIVAGAAIVVAGAIVVIAGGSTRYGHSPAIQSTERKTRGLELPARSVAKVLHDEVIKRPELHGYTPGEVHALLGQRPAYSTEIRMSDPQPEFRTELYKLFPPDDPATAKVVVLEERWTFPGYQVAVWYARREGTWRSINSLEWPDSVVF